MRHPKALRRRPTGLVSRDWLRERVLEKLVIIQTIKDRKGKYGRYLAEIWLDGQNVNDQIVEAGHAEYKAY
ncbi:MAG: thermonuclease family protein [Candidatus Thiodiazotropha endolucinida]